MINIQTAGRGRQGTQARGEDTRRRILETALDLFAAHGYEGASTRQIAEGAGVNLPAIQYYFGSKEGLYRAIIEDIVADTERQMSGVLPRVRVALEDPGTTPAELTELLCQTLEAFITVVTSGPQVGSRRLIFARADLEETPGLDRLHERGMRQVFNPCLALFARIQGKSETDPEITMRTMALIGQVVIFCSNYKRPIFKAVGLEGENVLLMKQIVREQTFAICRAVVPGRDSP